jgi:hypothetical protein
MQQAFLRLPRQVRAAGGRSKLTSPTSTCFPVLCTLSLVVKSVPGAIIVGREHVTGLHAAGEVVMAVEIPVAIDLNKPGTTTGTTGQIAGYGDYLTACILLPDLASGILACLPGLTIEGISSRIAIGREGLLDRLIVEPTSTADYVGQ